MNISVSFTCEVSDDASEEQIQEWLEYELGASASMDSSNPCCGDIGANSSSVYFNS